MAIFKDETSRTEPTGGPEKYVGFGVLLISAMIAVISAGFSVYLGNGWLGTIMVFFAAGTASSFLLLLFLIFREMRKQDTQTQVSIPPQRASQTQDCVGKAA